MRDFYRKLTNWRAAGLLLLFTLFFYWKVLFTNGAMFPWDAANFFYPYFSFVHEELRHFRLPFWDPYVMSGFPIIGDLEAQIFYPINWLFVLLSPFSPLPYRLVEVQLILHFFLAGLFMFYLARDYVRSTEAALLSALLYMAGGAMVAHTQHVASINAMAWYPLVFMLARRGLLKKSYFHAASAGMVFGIQTLAGHWQHAVYLGLLLFLYFTYKACLGPQRRQLWPRWIAMLALIGGTGAGLAMVQIVPTWELGNLSVRTYLTFWDVTAGNEPLYLLTLFLPNFFGGLNGVPQWYPYDLTLNYVFLTVPGLLLAIAGLAREIRRRDFFWLALVLLCVELSFGYHGHLGEIVYRIPILNLFRMMTIYYDLANFALCLMAALGAEILFSRDRPAKLRTIVPAILLGLLALMAAVGLLFRLGENIAGWYHMLVVLALFSILVLAILRDRLPPAAGRWAVLGLVVFELCFYNANQDFNTTPYDPRSYVAHDSAIHRKESLNFLRSDPVQDFRVGGIAEYAWSGNGWNIWRIPGIYGWNPITLRHYDAYIRNFTYTSGYTLPERGSDHDLNSPMLDLLGTKYLVVLDPDIKETGLPESDKFQEVFNDQGWWRIYRNKGYLSRAWFYPRGYAVAGQDEALALMSSRWFKARETLIFERGDLPNEATEMIEVLETVPLFPQQWTAASNTPPAAYSRCSEVFAVLEGGGNQDHWLRFDTGPVAQGRYLLLMRYTAADPQIRPSVEVQVAGTGGEQRRSPVAIPRTPEWACYKTRSVELGEFQLSAGNHQVALRDRTLSSVQVYSLWLARLPSSTPLQPVSFSFKNFSYEPNRLSFDLETDREGFALLNEIHYPGWQATIDGRRVQILKANTIFRALPVPAGSHHIELVFRPRYLLPAAAVSVLTLAFYILYAAGRTSSRILPVRKHPNKRADPHG